MTGLYPSIAPSFLQAIRVVAVLLLGALMCVPSSPAGAAKKPATEEMVFTLVRASDPICEPNCPEWIAADGEITSKTTKAFKAILKQVGRRNLPLLINSGGGRVDIAMAMGQIIRERQMTVEVARTDYLRCVPRDNKCKPDLQDGVYYGYANTTNAGCFSACPLVLAGGVRRIAGPVSRVGVHQIVTLSEKYRNKYKVWKVKNKSGKFVEKRKLIKRQKIGTTRSTKLSKKMRRELGKYFDDMGVKKTLIDLIVATPHEDIRILNVYELKAYGLATEYWNMDVLVQSRVCTTSTPPAHCIVRE